MEILEHNLDQPIWPGDRIYLTYDLLNTNPYWVALWLREIENKIAAQHLFKYLGYSWDPDEGRIVFELEVNNYVQDLETQKIVPIVDGKMYRDEAVPIDEASVWHVVAFVAGILVTVVGYSAFQHTRTDYRASEVRKIMESGDLTPEEKQAALQTIGKPSGLGPAMAAGTAASVAGFAIAVVLLVWLYRVFTNGRNGRARAGNGY